jgi:general secretion pathway protein B
MSFILDALKKSENERQRQSGPGIFEVKVAPPKARWPAWAFALAGLLVINIGVVVWLMLRQPSHGDAVAAPAAQASAPLPLTPAPQVAVSAPVEPAKPQEPAPMAADEPTPNPTEETNPDDYEPATEPSSAQLPETPHVTRGTVGGLPTYDEMASRPGNGLPDLRLDLHVYAAKPQDRFIFLNMRRLREGDSLPDGVRVESITAGGAVLSFRGSKFTLERD